MMVRAFIKRLFAAGDDMKPLKRLILALIMAILPSLPAAAQVAEDLRFSKDAPPRMAALIDDFLKTGPEEFQGGYDTASIDLNEDGSPEFILRQTGCVGSSTTLCPYLILAQRAGKIVSLGEVKARKIALGNDYANGVRSLAVFKNHVNDFAYDVYNWNANEQRFTN